VVHWPKDKILINFGFIMKYETEKGRNLIKELDKNIYEPSTKDINYDWWRKRGSIYQTVEEQYKIDQSNVENGVRKKRDGIKDQCLLDDFLNQIIKLLPNTSSGVNYVWFLKNQNGNLDKTSISNRLLLNIVNKGITKFKDENNPSLEGDDWGKILFKSLSKEEAWLGWKGGSEDDVKKELKELLTSLCKDKTLLGIVKNKLKEELDKKFNETNYQLERGDANSVGEKIFQLLKTKIDNFDNTADVVYFYWFLLDKRLRFMKGKFEMEIFAKHILSGLWDANKKKISGELLFERHINYEYRLAEIVCNNYDGFGETDPQPTINQLEEELNKFWEELDTIAYITSLKLRLLKNLDPTKKVQLEQRFNQEVIGEEGWWNDFAKKASREEIKEKIEKAENFGTQEKLTWEAFFKDPSRNITNLTEQAAWKNSGLEIDKYPSGGTKSEPEVAWDNGWKNLTASWGVTNLANKKLTYENHEVKTDNVEPLKMKKDDLDIAHEWIKKNILDETDKDLLPTDSTINGNNNELGLNKLPPGFKDKVKQIRDEKRIGLLSGNTAAGKDTIDWEKLKREIIAEIGQATWDQLVANASGKPQQEKVPQTVSQDVLQDLSQTVSQDALNKDLKKVVDNFSTERLDGIPITLYSSRKGENEFAKGAIHEQANAFTRWEKAPKNPNNPGFEIHFIIERNNRLDVFRTLAHEMTHAFVLLKEKKKELYPSQDHSKAFWGYFLDGTDSIFAFMQNNLEKKEGEEFAKLLNPITNAVKNDSVRLAYFPNIINDWSNRLSMRKTVESSSEADKEFKLARIESLSIAEEGMKEEDWKSKYNSSTGKWVYEERDKRQVQIEVLQKGKLDRWGEKSENDKHKIYVYYNQEFPNINKLEDKLEKEMGFKKKVNPINIQKRLLLDKQLMERYDCAIEVLPPHRED